jgi:hypothetical protein
MNKKEIIIFIISIPTAIFLIYLLFGFMDWITGDPLNIINNFPMQ